MNHQMPWNFTSTGTDNEMGGSSNNEDSYDFPDSCVARPSSSLQTSRSLETITSETDEFQDVFGALMDIQPSVASSAHAKISIVSTLEISDEPDKGKSCDTIRKPEGMVLQKCQSDIAIDASEELEKMQNIRPKRTRSAEVHNLSERRRRDRINKKLKTLRELVPNCDKSDRASVLDDAINYIKYLRLQIEMMSAAGGGIFQAPFMSPSGIQSTQVAQFSPYVPIRPKLGMGVGFGMFCSASHPMLSVPSATLHPSLSAEGVGSLASSPRNVAVSQMNQMTFTNWQQLPKSADASAMLRNFAPGVSPALINFSSQTESGSQTMPISEDHFPFTSSSTMPM